MRFGGACLFCYTPILILLYPIFNLFNEKFKLDNRLLRKTKSRTVVICSDIYFPYRMSGKKVSYHAPVRPILSLLLSQKLFFFYQSILQELLKAHHHSELGMIIGQTALEINGIGLSQRAVRRKLDGGA